MSLDASAIVRFTRFLISHKLTDLKVKDTGEIVRVKPASAATGTPTEEKIADVNLADEDGFSAAEMTKCGIATPSLVDCVIDDEWTNSVADRKAKGIKGITAGDLEKSEKGMRAWADAHGLKLSDEALWALYYANADVVHEEKIADITAQRAEAKAKIGEARGGKAWEEFIQRLPDSSPLKGFTIADDEALLSLLYISRLSIPEPSRVLVAIALKSAYGDNVNVSALEALLKNSYRPADGKIYDGATVVAYLKLNPVEPAPAPPAPPASPAPNPAAPAEPKILVVEANPRSGPLQWGATAGQIKEALPEGRTLVITKRDGKGYKITKNGDNLLITDLEGKTINVPSKLNDILIEILGPDGRWASMPQDRKTTRNSLVAVASGRKTDELHVSWASAARNAMSFSAKLESIPSTPPPAAPPAPPRAAAAADTPPPPDGIVSPGVG